MLGLPRSALSDTWFHNFVQPTTQPGIVAQLITLWLIALDIHLPYSAVMRRSVLGQRAHNGFKTRLTDSGGSTLRSGNVTVAGRRTSIRLKPAMWQALREISAREGKTMHTLATEIERARAQSSLTAAIRVFLLDYFRAAATEEGHRRAGHRLSIHAPL